MVLARTVQLQTAQTLFQVSRICKIEVFANADDEHTGQGVLLCGRVFVDRPPCVCAGDAALVDHLCKQDVQGRERSGCTRTESRAREERWITSKRETATETVIPTSTFHKSVRRNVSAIMARSGHAPNLDESVSS